MTMSISIDELVERYHNILHEFDELREKGVNVLGYSRNIHLEDIRVIPNLREYEPALSNKDYNYTGETTLSYPWQVSIKYDGVSIFSVYDGEDLITKFSRDEITGMLSAHKHVTDDEYYDACKKIKKLYDAAEAKEVTNS